MNADLPRHREVRSFVRREGRITQGQRRALQEQLPQREWPTGTPLLLAVTGRRAPLTLEIGAGDGENIAAVAAARPAEDFIACEVHGPGVGHLLLRAETFGLTNLWVAQRDVNELLAGLPNAALSSVYLFFPDPWPKKRHQKRRIFQADLLNALARTLARHGCVFVATDCADYARWMLEQIAAAPGWYNLAGAGLCAPRLRRREVTKFERKALREGRSIFDFVLALR